MTINERIKYLRKNIFCLSQAELAEKLGISQPAVAGIERKHGIVSEQTIKFFCLLYSVNEEWLRNGGDKIFSDSDNLNAFIKIHNASETEIEIFKAYLSIKPGIRHAILEQFKDKLISFLDVLS